MISQGDYSYIGIYDDHDIDRGSCRCRVYERFTVSGDRHVIGVWEYLEDPGTLTLQDDSVGDLSGGSEPGHCEEMAESAANEASDILDEMRGPSYSREIDLVAAAIPSDLPEPRNRNPITTVRPE